LVQARYGARQTTMSLADYLAEFVDRGNGTHYVFHQARTRSSSVPGVEDGVITPQKILHTGQAGEARAQESEETGGGPGRAAVSALPGRGLCGVRTGVAAAGGTGRGVSMAASLPRYFRQALVCCRVVSHWLCARWRSGA
jgi:hypothetical protein